MAPKGSYLTPPKRDALNALDALCTPTPRKRINTRSPLEATKKIMKDHFQQLSHACKYVLLVDGFTLFGKILSDYTNNRNGNGPKVVMGKFYYQDLTQRYGSRDDPIKQLRPADPSQPCDDGFEDALACHAQQNGGGFRNIVAWLRLRGDNTINQITTVSLYQHMLAYPPTSMKNFDFDVECLKYIGKSRLDEMHVQEWRIIKDHADLVMKCHHEKSCKAGISTSTWYSGYYDAARLILPHSSMIRIMEHQDENWIALSEDVQNVHNAGACGRHIVRLPYEIIQGDKINDMLKNFLNQLKDQHITDELVSGIKISFNDELHKMGMDPLQKMPGQSTTVQYRSTCYPVPCSSVSDALAKMLSGYIYGIGVENGQIRSIWSEDDLIEAQRDLAQWKVDDILLKQHRQARDAAHQMMETHSGGEPIIGEILKSVMTQNHSLLVGIDPTWDIIDHLFQSIVGAQASGRFTELVSRCLPSSYNMITPKESLKRFNALSESKVMPFLGFSFIAQLKAITDAVNQIERKVKAEIFLAGNMAMKGIAAKIGLWISCRDEENEKDLRGKAAAVYMFTKIMAQDKKDIDHKMLQELICFSYLLDDHQVQRLMTLKTDLAGGAITSIVATDPSSSATSSATTSGNRALALRFC